MNLVDCNSNGIEAGQSTEGWNANSAISTWNFALKGWVQPSVVPLTDIHGHIAVLSFYFANPSHHVNSDNIHQQPTVGSHHKFHNSENYIIAPSRLVCLALYPELKSTRPVHIKPTPLVSIHINTHEHTHTHARIYAYTTFPYPIILCIKCLVV